MTDQTTGERTRRSLVNLRINADDRVLITRATEALGKNRSEFMLDAVRQAAQDTLLDRRLFGLDADRFDALVTLLLRRTRKLKRLLATPLPWER